MVINEGVPVPEEKSERTKLLDCLENVRHGNAHPNGGAGDHPHFHSPYEKGENHHGTGEKHHDWTPDKNSGFYKEHSHKHEGDSLTVLDVETNEFAAEHEFSDFDGMQT